MKEIIDFILKRIEQEPLNDERQENLDEIREIEGSMRETISYFDYDKYVEISKVYHKYTHASIKFAVEYTFKFCKNLFLK